MPDPQQNQPQQLPSGLDQNGMSPSLADITSMTHQAEQPGPLKSFFDYARQPAPAEEIPGRERINQAISRQDPRYVPMQPPPQQNWQHWIEEAISNLPFGFSGALRMVRSPSVLGTYSDVITPHNFDLHHVGTGKRVGSLRTAYNNEQNHLSIDYMSSYGPNALNPGFKTGTGDQRYWGIGTAELQSLFPEIQREFPNINTVHFSRPAWGLDLTYQVERDAAGNIDGWRRIKKKGGARTTNWGGPGPRARELARPEPRPEPPPLHTPNPPQAAQMDQATIAGQQAALAAHAAGRSVSEANAAFTQAYRAEMERLRNPRSSVTPLSQPASRELTPQETAAMMEQLKRALGVRR